MRLQSVRSLGWFPKRRVALVPEREIISVESDPPSWTSARKNRRDTETQGLEDYLTSFIKGLIGIAITRLNRKEAPNDE